MIVNSIHPLTIYHPPPLYPEATFKRSANCEVGGRGSTAHTGQPSLLTPIASSGDPQTILMFDSSLDGLRPIESCHTYGYGLLQRKDPD